MVQLATSPCERLLTQNRFNGLPRVVADRNRTSLGAASVLQLDGYSVVVGRVAGQSRRDCITFAASSLTVSHLLRGGLMGVEYLSTSQVAASSGSMGRMTGEREQEELEEKLTAQLTLLDHLGRLYDDVTTAAALPLATSLRVILHNTGSSHALLALLGELETTDFLDTSLRPDARNLLPTHNGLVVMKVATSGAMYEPRLAAEANQRNPPQPFAAWWSAMVIRDASSRTWTRRSAVLALANKEGGAHIDPRQPASIKALEAENSMGWTFTHGGDSSQFTNGPLAPTVRQIAYEVLQTLTGGLLE